MQEFLTVPAGGDSGLQKIGSAPLGGLLIFGAIAQANPTECDLGDVCGG
jgi:hypothetical protein